jgi:hypothetical protein
MPKTSYIICVVLLFLDLVLFSCKTEKLYSLPPPKFPDEMPDKSTKITAEVFFDASLSMQGFANPGIATDYARVLDRLEGSLTSGWPQSAVKFFRFGAGVLELSAAERSSLNFAKPSFYDNPELKSSTLIENAIRAAKAENLTIIITDLFQNDADVTKLISLLKDNFLAKGCAVGLFGIKSAFAGTVYDVGINYDKFDYSGLRPFYLLMIGKHADIAYLFDCLKARIAVRPEKYNFILFSQYFSSPSPKFGNDAIFHRNGLDKTSGIFSRNARNFHALQLRINPRAFSAHLRLKTCRSALPYLLDLSNSDFDVQLLPSKAAWLGKKDTLVACPAARDAIKTTIKLADSLQLESTLDGTKLAEEGLYVFEQIIRPKSNSLVLPAWLSEWDLDLTKLGYWKQNPESFAGQTTLNLNKFAFDLWQTFLQTQKPEVAHLFYYIKKQ